MKSETVPASTGRSGLSAITATPMPAHRDDWERRVLADPNLLRDMADAIGGPFHLLYPQRVVRNIREFQRVFAGQGVVGAIYYGKKANKSPAVVRACARAGAGVDVSSAQEFTAALSGGVRGTDLMVTGPSKSTRLLSLAVRHRALVAVDDPDELTRLGALANGDGPARVVLRVLPPNSTSRFGLTCDELDLALTAADEDSIRLEGFSFHLTGYAVADRAELALALIERCREARGLGHPVTTISIGGGFGVNYVAADTWRTFLDGVNPRWFHGDRAPESYYPYHCPVPGPAMLAAILEHRRLADHLRAAGIRLAIEPGRALLDRAGSSVFRVQGVKSRTAHGHRYAILTVDGTSLSLSEQWFESEYLPDPVLWPARPGALSPTCVGGASCLEDDMLSRRRIPLPRPAEIGDLLVYPNTAGYQMDSNESAFHELPVPPKVVLHTANDAAISANGELRWRLDGKSGEC
ncbi:Y4yA family PLP-dependent enzyme [Nocardia sp. NPDC005978]|uniref:Y4yA family PLP-dependent enzyme n=1 Tax=Nocardia sp. NPDC005978 TaxID=3156725 RepID=UPI0033BD7776